MNEERERAYDAPEEEPNENKSYSVHNVVAHGPNDAEQSRRAR